MTFSFRSLCCLCFLLLTTSMSAQTLQRKGAFGASMQATADGTGIRILKVIPNSTASAMKLKADDIILALNGVHYNDVNPLIAAIGHWRVGDELEVEVQIGDSYLSLAATVVGKPLETSEQAEIIYGSVNFDGGMLRSILALPNGIANPPVIMFLPGVGCGSLDFYYATNAPTKLLIEGLLAQGLAVFRVEKPGMGDSQGTKDCLEMDFDYEVAAMTAGLHSLKQNAKINAAQIFLYGHSLGVVSAPLVAKENKVAGIIAWGGVAKSWYEYELQLLREQRVLMGNDYVEVDAEVRQKIPFLYDFYINKKAPSALAKNPDFAPLVESYFPNNIYHGLHHYSYFQNLGEVDVLTAYKQAECPVIAIAGELDLHAINTDWAKAISDAVNFYNPETATYVSIPKTTHHYHTVPSMAAYVELRSHGKLTGAYMAEHHNADVAQVVGQWIRDRLLEQG